MGIGRDIRSADLADPFAPLLDLVYVLRFVSPQPQNESRKRSVRSRNLELNEL